jgi:hypothetical protein
MKHDPQTLAELDIFNLTGAVRALVNTEGKYLKSSLGQLQLAYEQLGDLLAYLRGNGGNAATELGAYARAALGAPERDRGK